MTVKRNTPNKNIYRVLASAKLPLHYPSVMLPPDVSSLLPNTPPHYRLPSEAALARRTTVG
jgi:hypothetical protein